MDTDGGSPLTPGAAADELRRRCPDLLVKEREPLAGYTSFRIGGPADLYAEARTPEDLRQAVRTAREMGLDWLLLGGGTNVLVADKGVRGLVIHNLARGHAIGKSAWGGINIAESGAPLPRVARAAVRKGLAGLEFAVEIPGTVGGAIVSNAGAYGMSVADALTEVTIVDRQGQVRVVDVADLQLGYRTSRFRGPEAKGETILQARFELEVVDKEELMARVDDYRRQRAEKQPSKPSAGSVFKNPPGASAGYLIEQVGLTGAARGGATISPKHANFIVNRGGARAEDVVGLIELARERVLRDFGVELELEIELVGDW